MLSTPFGSVILQGGDKLGVNRDRNLLFDESVITLSLERVKEVSRIYYHYLKFSRILSVFKTKLHGYQQVVNKVRDELRFLHFLFFRNYFVLSKRHIFLYLSKKSKLELQVLFYLRTYCSLSMFAYAQRYMFIKQQLSTNV